MIVKVAWRNIWRSKLRSTIVIIAIALGLWAGVFASAFVVGLMEQKIDSVIRLEMSHFHVHHPEFSEEMLPKFTIENKEELLDRLHKNDSVKGVSARVVGSVMMTSANSGGAIKVTGINPEEEKTVTELSERLVDGAYFEGVKRNPVLISSKTAEKYKIKLRSKVVLTMQDVNQEITAGAFRVVGIYDSKNPMYDKMNAFVLREDLQKFLGIGKNVHEIAVLLTEHALADPVSGMYQASRSDLEILPWMDLAPGMRIVVDAKDMYTYIIVGIIMVALLFSIVNTMLMAVLERMREIGVLMAVGMTKMRVFGMIMLETMFLSLIGGPFGLLLAWLSIAYFGEYGINLGDSAYGEMGFSNIVYPHLEPSSYISLTIMVVVMAILAAIYPARKALKLKPVEAIREI